MIILQSGFPSLDYISDEGGTESFLYALFNQGWEEWQSLGRGRGDAHDDLCFKRNRGKVCAREDDKVMYPHLIDPGLRSTCWGKTVI
jgi:hypothetical protein